ncbi:hypothetical protein ACHQM5_011537 [Ranunculus cassubicifolius]
MKITNFFNPKPPIPLILLLITFNFSFSHSIFSPIDNYLLDCGSSTNSLIDNRNFIGDSSKSGSNLLSSPSISFNCETPSQNLSPLYHNARIFKKKSKYVFGIKKQGTHVVRLHFSAFNSSKYEMKHALFHVEVNGYLVLSYFNGKDSILKEYMIWVDNGKNLEIVFTPVNECNFGFVSAIEVFDAPEDLIVDTAKLIKSEGNETIAGITHHALETVYRLNVGGPKVTPFNDTLWRTWIPDDEMLNSSDGAKAIHFGGRIKYQTGGLSREVGPDNVYNSARVLEDPNVPNPVLTWKLPVHVGYKYLVRLHFCDIASKALYELYFNVYINGNLAYENLDLSMITGMLASPYYADFVVEADTLDAITVSIYPSTQTGSAKNNVVLNGIEVMKMNNAIGSLDGRISAVSLTNSRVSTGALVPAIALACFLMAAFAVVYKRRITLQDSVGWSPLPVDASEGNLKHNNQRF